MPPSAAPVIEVPVVARRQFHFNRQSINEEERRVELSFSSEEPVTRLFGIEILDHSSGSSADLARLNNGAALLFNHDMDRQIGVVESARIDTDGKVGRAVVRFSKSPFAQEKFDEVRDGILTKVSFSYELDDADVEIKSQKAGPDTIRFKKWRALEISLVTVPADDTVGVGRSIDTQKTMKLRRNIQLDPAPSDGGGGGTLVVEDGQRGNGGPDPKDQARIQAQLEAAVDRERERISEIQETGQRHNIKPEEIQRFIKEKRSVDEFVRFVLTQMGATPHTPARNNDGVIGMNEKEVRSYSLVRAIRCLALKKPLDGLEREASEATAKRIGRDAEGFFIPDDIAFRTIMPGLEDLSQPQRFAIMESMRAMQRGRRGARALSAGTDAAGGFTVQTDVLGSSLIELLRNKALMLQLGARNLSGLVGDIAIPTHTGAVTASWLAEGAADTASDQTFGQLALVPRRLAGATAYSKRLLAQSSIDVEAFVREDIATTLAVEKDHKAINGSGASNQPTGILATSGIGTVAFVTDTAPTWPEIVEFETDVETANAAMGRLVYLATPALRGKMKTTVKESGQAKYIWDSDNPDFPVNGYEAHATNQMPANGVLFGNFQDLIMADWAGIDIVVNPYSLDLNNQVRITVNLHTDIGVRHAGSFSKADHV